MGFLGQLLILLLTIVTTTSYQGRLKQLRSTIFRPSPVIHSIIGRNCCQTKLGATDGDQSLSSDTVVSRCTKKIVDSLNPMECTVTSTDDDPNGSHVSLIFSSWVLKVVFIHPINLAPSTIQIQIVCIADVFEGKSSLQRQRLIYKAIWDEMSGPVHAVDSIIAKTPTEMGLWRRLSSWLRALLSKTFISPSRSGAQLHALQHTHWLLPESRAVVLSSIFVQSFCDIMHYNQLPDVMTLTRHFKQNFIVKSSFHA